jgi:hypothetical protein
MLAEKIFTGGHIDLEAGFGSLLRMSDAANAETECENGQLCGIHKTSPSWDLRKSAKKLSDVQYIASLHHPTKHKTGDNPASGVARTNYRSPQAISART